MSMNPHDKFGKLIGDAQRVAYGPSKYKQKITSLPQRQPGVRRCHQSHGKVVKDMRRIIEAGNLIIPRDKEGEASSKKVRSVRPCNRQWADPKDKGVCSNRNKGASHGDSQTI